MKFQQEQGLEKHLQEAYPHHLSRAYMVIAPFEAERKKIVKRILEVFTQRNPDLIPLKKNGGEGEVEDVLEHLNTRPLFDPYALVVLEGVEKLKKPDLERLTQYLFHPSKSGYLILGSSSLKQCTDLYQKGKKELVLLDLSEEKPWDRQKRLRQWLVEEAKKEGKKLSGEAVSYLFEQVGSEFAILEQELNKLICYVGDRAEIDLSDAISICSSRIIAPSWQMAEGFVWEETSLIKIDSSLDLSSLLLFIGQLRYHLQIGQQIASQLDNKVPLEEIASSLPKLKIQMVEKYVGAARKKGKDFFKRGLLALFELELACKNSALSPRLLWDLFIFKLKVSP